MLTALEANPDTGIVGYVDQPIAYQEFQFIFAKDPDIRDSLSEADIPPSLRVFVPSEDVARVEGTIKTMPGVERLTTPPGQPEAISIGVVQFELGPWRQACKLAPWQEPAPSTPEPSSTVGTVPSSGAEVFDVAGANMEPTLQPGDKISVSLGRHPARGQVVVVRPPSDVAVGEVIDRVIGLPGETIAAGDGHVIVNGRVLQEPWLPSGVTTSDFGPVVVPPGSYFVMGDNRGNSFDSRAFGTLPASSVSGVAVAIVYPPSRLKPLL